MKLFIECHPYGEIFLVTIAGRYAVNHTILRAKSVQFCGWESVSESGVFWHKGSFMKALPAYAHRGVSKNVSKSTSQNPRHFTGL